MRIKYARIITISLILSNILFVFFTWRIFINHQPDEDTPMIVATPKLKPKDKIQTANKHIKKAVTVIFRDFYHFENDLRNSVESILNLIPNIQILVVYDEAPYPPLAFMSNFTSRRVVKTVHLDFDVHKSTKDLTPLMQIKTKYVLFMPDSVRLSGRSVIQRMIRDMGGSKEACKENCSNEKGGKNLLIVPFAGNSKGISCNKINLDFAHWTIEYSSQNVSKNCDIFLHKHAVMIETATLREMPDALSSPFVEMFYIQAKLLKLQPILFAGQLQDGKRLFVSFHSKQRRREIRREQFKTMYRKLKIKKVIRKYHSKTRSDVTRKHHDRSEKTISQVEKPNLLPSSSVTDVQFYGCEKNTKSCIGPVYDMKPFYSYIGKHTPPCCAEKMKAVFYHVMEEFENVGIRYWMDNEALKSAIDTNNLHPDAFEIDISFHAFDLERSLYLKKCQTRPLSDSDGFYWIKATDGHYFRVQYSKTNHVGVNLLPFDINGEKVQPSGFFGWKAKEFSTEFLHPMSTVMFMGKSVNSPNNVREYLDYKGIE